MTQDETEARASRETEDIAQRKKRAILLYNKVSGRGSITNCIDDILAIFRDSDYTITAELMRFDYSKDENPFLGREDLDLVIIAGGDGTVNHIVNEIKTWGVKAAIAVIPAGTANDFAFAIGMDRDPLAAANQIATGSYDWVDCGYVNGLYFVNIFSFGIFTTTSQRTPHEQKNRFGRFAYLLQAIRDFRNLNSIDLTVITDKRTYHINSLMMLVLNGATAGGYRLVHNSNVSDGMLDCLILKSCSLLTSTIAMIRILLGGKPSAVKRIRTRTLQVLCPSYVPTDADGERGVDFPLNIECLHKELRIITPIPKKTLPTKH